MPKEETPTEILSEEEYTHPGAHHNKLLLSWKAPEFMHHYRSKKWFLIAAFIIILLTAYAIYTNSATMAIVFILLAGVYYLTHNQEPRIIEIKITELGIFVDETFYSYHMINSFWIMYHPPFIHTLNLRIAGKAFKRVVIQLDRQNPIEVRKILSKEIPEIEGEGENVLDMFSRLLRL